MHDPVAETFLKAVANQHALPDRKRWRRPVRRRILKPIGGGLDEQGDVRVQQRAVLGQTIDGAFRPRLRGLCGRRLTKAPALLDFSLGEIPQPLEF